MAWWAWVLIGIAVGCFPLCGVPVLPALLARAALRMRII